MTDDGITPILLNQRIRNGVMWYLEAASSFERQLQYQAAVPLVNVPNEMFNQWGDWIREDIPETYCEPVFSPDEQAAIWKYNAILDDVLDEVPETWPKLSELIKTKHWAYLRAAAESTLEVFLRRGFFSQDVEQF